MQPSAPAERDLILVGGGHAHVQVIKRWMMSPVRGVALSVVLDRADAVYSGMVPGFVAGEFEASELTIDLVPLVRRAGGDVILSAATRIDPVARRIELEDRPPLHYDVASLDVGSTVRGLDLPGVTRFALATRPIGRFVAELDERVAELVARYEASPAGAPVRVAVVGAGAAGVEIACTLHARLGALARHFEWLLLSADDVPMKGASRMLERRVRSALDERGIRFVPGSRVVEVRRDGVATARGDHPADLVIWAAGGAPLPVCTQSPLPLDTAGFVRVDRSLRVVGCEDLFAAGDCASFDAQPLPKAGVYAVRQGPVLARNLCAALEQRAPRPYRPQHDFLALLNVGDERAIAARNGFATESHPAWRLKAWIDRRFMRRFQVLDTEGRVSSEFAAGGAMGEDAPMECGGCAAKLGAKPLEDALAGLAPAPEDGTVVLGLDRPDDVAAVKLPAGDVLLATVDGFRAFDGDPHLVARVAAQNALSDVHAKGGLPRHALALVTVERGNPERMRRRVDQVLAGLRRELDEAGVSLVGGHTTTGPELFVALSVMGTLPDGRGPLAIDGLRAGDRLVLTKPLGTGVVLAADMRGELPGHARQAAIDSMLRSTAHAARAALEHDVVAVTDVSGFGLLGHLGEMLRASRRDAVIDPKRVPGLPMARALLARGLRSTAHEANAAAFDALDDAGGTQGAELDLLVDPQTSGGLLVAVSPGDCAALVEKLRAGGDVAACEIGAVRRGTGRVSMGDIDPLG